MTLHTADSHGRRFYKEAAPVPYRIEAGHTYARGANPGEWITTSDFFVAVTDDWFRTYDGSDFATTEHFRAPTRAEVEAWIASKG